MLSGALQQNLQVMLSGALQQNLQVMLSGALVLLVARVANGFWRFRE
jgi:hypothetical protein